jgi:hypothetical protein
MSTLSGKDFVAVRALYTRDGLVAKVGERCDFVPVESLPVLLASGKIAPAPKADKKAVK